MPFRAEPIAGRFRDVSPRPALVGIPFSALQTKPRAPRISTLYPAGHRDPEIVRVRTAIKPPRPRLVGCLWLSHSSSSASRPTSVLNGLRPIVPAIPLLWG
jgi:hypothetical protein